MRMKTCFIYRFSVQRMDVSPSDFGIDDIIHVQKCVFSVEPWTSRYMLDPMTNCTHSWYWCTHRIKKENYQHWHNILCLFSFMLIAQKTSHAYNTYYLMIAWKRNFKHGCSFSIRKKKEGKDRKKEKQPARIYKLSWIIRGVLVGGVQ